MRRTWVAQSYPLERVYLGNWETWFYFYGQIAHPVEMTAFSGGYPMHIVWTIQYSLFSTAKDTKYTHDAKRKVRSK
jgi:hypothetical protein